MSVDTLTVDTLSAQHNHNDTNNISYNTFIDGKLFIPKSQQTINKNNDIIFTCYGQMNYSQNQSKSVSLSYHEKLQINRNDPYLIELQKLAQIINIPKYNKMKKSQLANIVWDNVIFE